MKRDHRPRRTCLGCGARDEQRVLLRIVQQDGELRVDRLATGRGGYLHKAEQCWSAFLRKKSTHRALRVEVGRDVREKLIRTLRDQNRK